MTDRLIRITTALAVVALGATHWGAQAALDLLESCESEAMRLHVVRTRPLRLPSEPLRSVVIQLTAIASRRLTGERGGGGGGPARSSPRLGFGS